MNPAYVPGRGALVWALAVSVFALAFVYRFNAMLGSLYGFDGDHFIYYVGVKQVLAGDRPLRDFVDAGLQGAWPALTYELPAVAQRLAGETLFSEAVFCVAAIALATSLLFRSATSLAGVVPSVVVALLSLASSTRLYSYSKVLVSACAVALLLRYAKNPSTTNVAWLAAWSVVAFLFRHDYLVYVAAVTLFLVAILPGHDWATRSRRAGAYAALVTVLLAGPIYSVHHYVGLGRYLQTNLALTRSESARTDQDWPTFEATVGPWQFFDSEVNAAAWLYYLCLAVPLLTIGATFTRPRLPGFDQQRSRAVLLTLAFYTLLLDWFLLRGNLAARFGDLGAPVAVLAAWLAGAARGVPVWGNAARTAATVVFVVSACAVGTTGSVWQELGTTGLRVSARGVVARLKEVAVGLRSTPPPRMASPKERERTNRVAPTIVDYLRACTGPNDRLLVLADAPEVNVFASRAFAAGQSTFRSGFYALAEDQRLMLSRLERQSVPVVLTRDERDFDEHVAPVFRTVVQHVSERYQYVGELPGLTGGPMRVLVRRDALVSEPFGDTGMPCPF